MSEFGALRKHEKTQHVFVGLSSASLAAAKATRNCRKGLKCVKLNKFKKYLMFYAQSTVKGLIRVKQNVLLPEAKFGFITLKHILPPLKVFKTLEKNEVV